MKIYDISRMIGEETPVWPGDVPFTWRETIGALTGAPWGSTCFTMSAHCGTHADAPRHVFDDGAAIGEAPLAAYIGEARVLDLPGIGEMKARTILAVLGKRLGVSLPGMADVMPRHPTLGDVDSAEALATYQAGKRAYKAEMRTQGKRV